MRSTLSVLLLLVAIPASATGQRRPIEVGFDAAFTRFSVEGADLDNNDVIQIAIPIQGFRVGFLLSDLVSLETALSHVYVSSDGESASDFSLAGGLLYHLSPPVTTTTFYLGLSGAVNILDLPEDSDTQFGLFGEAGFKVLTGDSLGFRFAGFFQRAFESNGRFASNGVGVSVGVSFFIT